jgi:hypothetical protein
MEINTLSITFILYSWDGTTLTPCFNTNNIITYPTSGSSSINPLNQFRSLWFGKSADNSKLYANCSYQKILLYNGKITTMTQITPILTDIPNNSVLENFYTFGAPNISYTSLTVQMIQPPSIALPTTTTTEVSLNGNNQYLTLSNLSILEEDTTRIYDGSNNVLATIPSISAPFACGAQSVVISLSFILLPTGTGDPHIITVNGHEYMLPHDEKCYLLYDNNIENDRVIVTAKCWFLPDDIKNNSKFKNVLMTDTTFFKYINFYYNGENLTFDMETLNPVKYTNMKDLTKNHLKFIKNDTMIKMSELIEDKNIFKCHYSKLKLKRYNINFDGQSRMIELANDYKFKISFDLNCADHRNEIKIIEANFNNSTGALINEDIKNCIEYFIPPKNVFLTLQKFTT